VHDQIVGVDRPTKLAFEFESADGLVAQMVVEHNGNVAALLLRPVQGGVGVSEEIVGIFVALSDRNADRRRDDGVVVAHTNRLRERLAQASSGNDGVAATQHVADHDGELVATEAGDGVAGTDHVLDSAGDLGQQLVAGGMAQRFVDDLEAIEVEEQEADEQPAFTRPAQSVSHALHQQCPVGEAGEVVVERPLFELGRSLHLIGDVLGIEDDAADGGVVEEVVGHDLEMPVRTIAVGDPKLGRAGLAAAVGDAGRHLVGVLQVLGVDEFEHVDTVEAARRMTEDTLDGGRRVDHGAFTIDQHDEIGGVLDEGRHAGFGSGDERLRVSNVAHVPGDDGDRFGGTGVVQVGDEHGGHRRELAIGADDVEFAAPAAGLVYCGEGGGHVLGLRVLVQVLDERGGQRLFGEEVPERVVEPDERSAVGRQDADEVLGCLEHAGQLFGSTGCVLVLGGVLERQQRAGRRIEGSGGDLQPAVLAVGSDDPQPAPDAFRAGEGRGERIDEIGPAVLVHSGQPAQAERLGGGLTGDLGPAIVHVDHGQVGCELGHAAR